MEKLLVVVPVYVTYDLHLEFTHLTLNSIRGISHTNHDYKILVVVSYCSPALKPQLEKLPYDSIIYNEKNGVSIAWNNGIRYGMEQKYDSILVVNNDIIFHHQSFDNLVKFKNEHPEFILWTMAEWKGRDSVETRLAIRDNLKSVAVGTGYDEHPHFSAYMVTPESVGRLADNERGVEPYPGLFDENFAPAYFEDGDMHQRILFRGLRAGHTGTAMFYHYGSRTIGIDGELKIKNGMTYEKNRQYFQKKWAFDPHNRVVEHDDPVRYKLKKPFGIKNLKK